MGCVCPVSLIRHNNATYIMPPAKVDVSDRSKSRLGFSSRPAGVPGISEEETAGDRGPSQGELRHGDA